MSETRLVVQLHGDAEAAGYDEGIAALVELTPEDAGELARLCGVAARTAIHAPGLSCLCIGEGRLPGLAVPLHGVWEARHVDMWDALDNHAAVPAPEDFRYAESREIAVEAQHAEVTATGVAWTFHAYAPGSAVLFETSEISLTALAAIAEGSDPAPEGYIPLSTGGSDADD